MQDTAIAAIGRLEIKQMEDLELVDLYVQNMYLEILNISKCL